MYYHHFILYESKYNQTFPLLFPDKGYRSNWWQEYGSFKSIPYEVFIQFVVGIMITQSLTGSFKIINQVQVFIYIQSWILLGQVNSQVLFNLIFLNTFAVLSIYFHIRHQNHLKELENGMQKVEDNLMAVVHDIKNPILGAMCQLDELNDLIKSDNKNELKDKINKIESIKSELKQSFSMIDNYRYGYKMSNGSDFNEQDQDVDLNELSGNIQSENNYMCMQNNNRIQISLNNTPKYIKTKPTLFKRILSNLVSNSMKHCENNKILVDFYIFDNFDDVINKNRFDYKNKFKNKKDQKYLSVKVTDYGIGIKKENQHKILSSKYTGGYCLNFDGTGLGLPICVELAAKINGDIIFKSIPNIETVFMLIIPFNDIKKFKLRNQFKQNFCKTLTFDNSTDKINTIKLSHKIILIEDSPSIMRNYERMMSKLGLEYTKFMNGLSAYEYLIKEYKSDKNYYPLIISDNIMPKLSGMQLNQKLKELKYRNYFVLVTADECESYENVDKVYQKPFIKSKLLEVIDGYKSTLSNIYRSSNSFDLDEYL